MMEEGEYNITVRKLSSGLCPRCGCCCAEFADGMYPCQYHQEENIIAQINSNLKTIEGCKKAIETIKNRMKEVKK